MRVWPRENNIQSIKAQAATLAAQVAGEEQADWSEPEEDEDEGD